MRNESSVAIWLATGVRTPFAKVDGPLGRFDAIGLSVPVARHMLGLVKETRPDFAVWGAVVPNLTWSNIAREILLDAEPIPPFPLLHRHGLLDQHDGAIEAAGMIDGRNRNLALVGGVDSLTRIQVGWASRFQSGFANSSRRARSDRRSPT